MPAFGSPSAFVCDEPDAEHMVARTLYPDPDFCEYLLVFGANY